MAAVNAYGAVSLALLLLICATSVSPAASGLTPEQESWLDSVRFGNVSSQWPSLTQQQTEELWSNADQFMAQVWPVNFPWNQAVEVWFAEKNMSSKVVYYDDCGDSAAWTGLYLASLAHQYNVTRDPSTLGRVKDILITVYSMTMCTGKNGYLPRICGLAADPAYYAYYHSDPKHYNCASPMEEYVWLGDTSRDMYLGIAFGLGNVWHFVNDTETKALTQKVAENILDDLIKEHFWIVSPKGSITNPVPGFSAALRLLALTVNPVKYADQKKGYEIDFVLMVLSDSFALRDKWASGYFSNELNLEVMYLLTLLDRGDEERMKILQDAFDNVAITHSDHYQPGFAAFFLSALPNSPKADIPKGILQGGLLDYPSPPDWGRYVDQSNNTEYEPHKDSEHSEFALRVRDRPPDTYQWQRAPTSLKGGDKGPVQYPHIDFLLPYWMGRSSGFIGAP